MTLAGAISGLPGHPNLANAHGIVGLAKYIELAAFPLSQVGVRCFVTSFVAPARRALALPQPRMESTKTPASKQPILVLLACVAEPPKKEAPAFTLELRARVLTGIVDATETDRSLPFR